MSAVAKSSTRVEDLTPLRINEQIRKRTAANVVYFASHPEKISQRIAELDREWDIERWLQLNSSMLSLAGMYLAATRGKKWFLLPLAVQSFFLQHAIQGWCPPIPVLRRLGIRTSGEIQIERQALKVLRGDFVAAQEGAAAAMKAAASDGGNPAQRSGTLKSTAQRVTDNTDPEINRSIAEQTERQLLFCGAHPEKAEKRLRELDREWDVERLLEVEAPAISLFGTVMGLAGSAKWLVLPIVTQGMMFVHALQGYYPLLPFFRRLGFRTQNEIAVERYALKALRHDFDALAAKVNVQGPGLSDPADRAEEAISAATQIH